MQIEDIRLMQSQNEKAKAGAFVRTSLTAREEDKTPSAGGAFDVRIGTGAMPKTSSLYSRNQIKEGGLFDEMADREAHFTDTASMVQQLSMRAAGFTTEDFDEAAKEGYDVKEMEPREIITVVDKIKMELAKGGKDISDMGGLSEAELEAMAKSPALAAALERQLAGEDLPADTETVADAVTAVRKAAELSPLTDGAMKNLLFENKEPTIENLYRAEFGGENARLGAPANPIDDETFAQMGRQITAIIEEAHLPVDDAQMENARFLLEADLPVTAENLSYLHTLQSEPLTLTAAEVVNAITDAVDEGRMPQEAYLMHGFSLHDMAADVMDTVTNAADGQEAANAAEERPLTPAALARKMAEDTGSQNTGSGDAPTDSPQGNASKAPAADTGFVPDTPEAVRAVRVLQEARLVMTQEANLSLLKQGISIDTTELSDLVEQLKEQENAFYKTMFSGAGERTMEERIELFDQTRETISSLEEMPAALLGRIPEGAQATLERLTNEGQNLQAKMREAGERYETMRTEIRRDLGDSIKKAFRNVDAILTDIGLEDTETNERAVRILAYNELDITPESVQTMKACDEQVQRVFKNLTPAVVARMIRDGENPLDLSIEELNGKAEEIKAIGGAQSSEGDFADFLWKAEQSGDLTEEERNGFVGICRLIYQVEQTDGAVIGQLLHQGADVTLRNMMGAVRTRRHENREYEISDESGFLSFDKSVLSITDQIEMAFETNRMKDAKDAITPDKMRRFGSEEAYLGLSPDRFAEALSQMEESSADLEAEKRLADMTKENVKEAIASEQRVYDILNRFDLAQTPANLEAMSRMLADRNGMYRRLFGRNDRRTFGDEADIADTKDITDVMEDVMKAFGEAVKTPEDMAEAQRKLEDIATNVMKNMLMEQPVGTIDVRGMQVAIKQIRAIGQMGSKAETYAVPITVADETGSLSLKIVRGKEEDRGLVDVALSTERLGNIYASFRYSADGIDGTVNADTPATRELLAARSEEWKAAIAQAAEEKEVRMTFGFDARTDANAIFDEPKMDFDTTNERPEVQTRALYGLARAAIDAFSML
ncbi:MAG: hypothetical protein IJT32_00765 [Lachnospiraceae bacterium]|nr:hypothetical protein [Lachnospiraceae bacterium]